MDKKCKRSKKRGQIRRPRLEDFKIPDRTFSDYFCKICNSHMNSNEMWDSHIQGRRHHKKVTEHIGTLPDKPFHQKSAKIPLATPVIEKRLRNLSDPIIGLKYISEINKSDLMLGPIYKCFLCHACLPNGDFLIDHLYSSKHILAYGQIVDPGEYKSMVGFGKNAMESFAAEWAARLERKYGRGRMNVEFEDQDEGSEYDMAIPKTEYNRNDPPKKIRAEYLKDDSPLRRHRLSGVHLSEFSDQFSDSSSGNYRSLRERSRSYEVSSFRNESFTDSKSRTEKDRLRSIHEIENLQRYLLAKARRTREKERDKNRNSTVSRRQLLPLPWPKENKSSVKKYASANTSTSDVKSHTKIFLNMEFLKAVRNSPPSVNIKLLEKMGPFVVTSDEECDRLNKIAMAIERSCMDYKYRSLNALQKRKILMLLEQKPDFFVSLIRRCTDK